MNKYREQYKKDTKENADNIIYPSRNTYIVFTNEYVKYLEEKLSSAEAEIEELKEASHEIIKANNTAIINTSKAINIIEALESEIERLRKSYKWKHAQAAWFGGFDSAEKVIRFRLFQAGFNAARELSEQPKTTCPDCNNYNTPEICFDCEDHDKYQPATEQGK